MTKLSVPIPEAAEMLGVSRSHLYVLFKKKKLTPRKMGKRTLILVEDLKRCIENLPAAS